MKVNLRKSTKTILKIAGLMIVLLTTIVAICMRQANNKISLTEEQLFENRVAKSYNELTNADKETNVANVKFGAYFLRDLEGNNVAHMLDGTCKQIGEYRDELYFDIQVSGDSYIDNAKIKITNANFYAQFNYLKDDYLKDNYKGVYSVIEFNRIEGGSEEQIYGSISTATINNYNDYSKTALVTFTCDYHDIYTGEVEQVEKIVPITVDWYGSLNTAVRANTNSYAPKPSGNTVSTTFEVEEFSDLLLKDRTIVIKVPNIRQWSPVSARLSDANAVYDPEMQTLTLTSESVYDENGELTNSIPKKATYTIYATYPEDAFYYSNLVGSDDIFNGRDAIKFDTTVTTNAYSNQKPEFENIVSSTNTVYPTVNFHPQNAEPAPLGTTLIVRYEHQREEISIQRILENYEGVRAGEISANNIDSSFNTHITIQRGAIKDFGLLNIEEDYLKFGAEDITPYLKDTRITYSGISAMIEEDGVMKVYNFDTDELIKELSYNELKQNKDITIPENVARVRIELTNFKKCEGTTSRNGYVYAGNLADIYISKTLDTNKLINNFEYNTIKNFSKYYSRIRQANYIKGTGALENTTTVSDDSTFKYDKSEAMITVSPKTFGNNGEVEDEDEIGDSIKFVVSSRHLADHAYWSKGEFVIELPQEFNYFNLESVTSSTCTIDGYEYFEEDGKKLIRVFADTAAQILFEVKGRVVIDPMATNGNKAIKLYYKNEACGDYLYSTSNDIYDVDLNGDKVERVGYTTAYITITSPSTFIVKQMVTNYDDNGTFATAPNVAEVDKESNRATVEILVKNNNASPVIDCYLVGKILYEGNTKVKSDTNLNSQFTTHMTSDGITVPEELSNVTVYYSENDSVNFDLNDISNEWKTKDEITDWSKVKTFAIDLSQVTIRAGGNTYAFKYDVSVPNGLSYNDVSYCTVASKYNLQTSAGILYGRGTEAQKTGIRIVRKYDLDATLYKETTNRIVPDENYIVEELDDQNNVVKTKMGKSDSNGKFKIKNLYAERNYRIRQTIANVNYENDDNVRYFRTDENSEGNLVFSYANNQSDLFNNTPSITKDAETNKDTLNVSMWETPKYEIVINKLDRVTEQPIGGVNFLCYNDDAYIAAKTDNTGKATMMRFSEGTNYTLEEVTAKGYYLQDTSIRLSKNMQYNYSVVIGNNEFVHSATANNGGDSQDLAKVELTLYNDSVPTYTLNVVKIKETTKAVTSSDIVKLSGAEYELKKYDDNEKETITTGDDGTATVNNMYQYREGFDITGKYGLQETKSPDGYVLNKEYIEFVVSKENDTLKIEYKDEDSLTSIKDTVIDGTNVTIYLQDKSLFKLTKTDDDHRLLANIGFVIYELDTNGEIVDYAKDVNGEYVGTQAASGAYIVRTDSTGEVNLPLADGDYLLYEVDAPAEYEYSTTGRRFKIKREEAEDPGTGTGTGSETTEEKFTYQVQYYYNGQRDDSKTETYEVDKDTEVTTYVDKSQDGYELQYVTKLPYKISCDDLAIDVYYATPKTETLEINYIEDLIDLQIAVNNGNHYENTKVVLKKDLDFNDNDSYRNYEDTTTYGDYNEDEVTEGIKREVTSGRGWKSIGIKSTRVSEGVNGDYVLDENQNASNQYGYDVLKYFSGTFDGNNHSISNMYVDFTTSAYGNTGYTYTRNYYVDGSRQDVEINNYYNAALFGWTHNATIQNLKFNANIKENRSSKANNGYLYSEERVSEGVGLVGNSYGSINIFNVENDIIGNFSFGGVVGTISQRLNYFDKEDTNINIQDVKNNICINNMGRTSDTFTYMNYIGVIGRIYNGVAHDSEIAQNIELNNIENNVSAEEVSEEVAKDFNSIEGWGTIGSIVAEATDDTDYYNDHCKMYSIKSNITAYAGNSIGGIIGYMDSKNKDIAEYKFNNLKTKVAFRGGYYNAGVIAFACPEDSTQFLIENFETELTQTAEDGYSMQEGGVLGYITGSRGKNCVLNIKNGKSTVHLNNGSLHGGIVGEPYYSLSISDVSTYGEIKTGSSQNGGIIGYSYASGKTLNIENVNNYVNLNCGGQSGGIVGLCDYLNVNIKNANNYGNITGGYQCGGIIGYASSSGGQYYLENVNNYGNISKKYNDQGFGGIVGGLYNSYTVIRNANNYGKIDGYYETGGIVGTDSSNGRHELYNCANSGVVTGYEYVGGIIGENRGSLLIDNSCNKADIKADKTINDSCYYLGGLVGYTYGSAQILNSYNKGNVTSTDQNYAYEIGGIVGYYSNSLYAENCYNDGNISITTPTTATTGYAYGVGGFGYGSGTRENILIKNFVNRGKIYIQSNGRSTSSNIGGVIGGYGGRLINVVNQGEIEIISANVDYYNIGGITGQNDNNAEIINAYNTGNITLLGGVYKDIEYYRGVGGIAGSNSANSTISNCYNSGKIIAPIITGGIAAVNRGTITDCYNEGKVTSYKIAAGGITGIGDGTISNVYNVGNVVAKNADVKAGPIIGINGIYDSGNITGSSTITNAYYSDKVAVLGEDINEDGIKKQDNYMRTTDFYDTLNENGVWTYMNGQYPKLMIDAGEEIPEAVELNIVNEHKVYTISTTLNNPARGSITGYNQQYLEEVRHGNSNTKEIEMIPKPGYVIGKVTINGKQQEITLNDDGTYKISVGQLENIQEDLLVYVEFMKQDQIVTLTKVDKDTRETIEGATFDIVQTESGSIDNAISELKESEIENVYGADLNSTVDEAIGNPDMTKGSFTRIDNGFSLTSVFDYRSGSRYYYAVIARVPIDLTNYTGEYIVGFETYTTIWDNCAVYNSENQSIGRIDMTGLPNGKYSHIYKLTGGEKYSIEICFRKTGNNFTEKVDNFHVYTAVDNVYNMITTDEGYFETTNANIPWGTSAGWVEVDLSKHIDCAMNVKYKIDQGSNTRFTMRVTNMGTDAEVYNKQYYSTTTEQTDTFKLTGGEKYKVEFIYKNVSGGPVKVQITDLSLTLDETKLVNVRKTTNQDGEIKVQLPVGKYEITEIAAPEHYILNSESTEYYVDIDKDNKVTIENEHKPRVRVHHYLMENGEATTKKVAKDEEYEGNIDDDYYFNPKDKLPGLSLAKDDNGELIIPANYKGKYTSGITDVNFYYEADDIKLTIHHYQEGTQNKVADDETIVKDAVVTFKQDGSYTVSTTGTYKVADNAKYQELIANDYNLTSLYSSVKAGLEIDDTLEYSSNAELIYNYNIKKYRIVTRVVEHDEVVTDDDEDEESDETNQMTNTTSNEIANNTTTNETENNTIENNTTNENTNTTNEVTNTTTNTTNTNTVENTTTNTTTETTPKTKTISVKGGTISGYDLEYYEELTSNANSTKDIIVTPDKGYKIKEIKLNDTVIYDADHTTNDLYTVEDGVVTFNKFNNVIEDKTITVEFEGVGSIVKVHHILVEDGKDDVEYKTVEIRGRVGSRYKTEAIEIDGYTLDSTSLNTTGEIAEDQIDVYYNYKANPEVAYTIRYFYDAIEDTTLAERLTGKMGTTITVEDIQAKIDGHKKDVYEFERAENIPLMIVNDVDEYVIKIYYISSYGKVVEKHIDAGHNTLLFTETHKGSIGKPYNIKARNITGYTLKTTDLDGNSILPTNAECTYQKDVVEVVTYYYSRNTTVKVVYQDENETELDKVIIEGHEGDEYTTEQKTIKGYELVEVPKNAEGVMLVTKDAEGNDNTETVVTYKYKKLIPADVVEKYVDVNTNETVEEVIHKGELEEDYEIVPKTIEGYTLITKDADGNDILPQNTKGKYSTTKVEVVYYVALNTTVRVQYINLITTEKMAEDIVIEGYEGKEYVTEAKTFDGYELTGTPENAKGTMKVTVDEDGKKVTELVVKYYYAEKLIGKLPQTSETNSKQAILIAIPFVVLINLALGTVAFKKTKREDSNE